MSFKPRFHPMLGLTIVTLIALAILISLGTWQYQRLGWKTDLIAQVEQAANAPAFDRFDAVADMLDGGAPIDFRRITVRGKYSQDYDGQVPSFHVFTPQDSAISWIPYRPFSDGTQTIFIAGQPVSDALKSVTPQPESGPLYVAGYVRLARKAKSVALPNTPEANRWFSFNPEPDVLDWGAALSGEPIETRYYIDPVSVSAQPITDDLPVRIPEIRNNHFDYMLTWYSFAIILLFIYVILHRRAGRLSFRG